MTAVRPHWWPAYIGIGSNLDDPEAQVARAFVDLAALPDTLLTLRSGLYRSDPVGPAGQPCYVNACAALLTRRDAATLLADLHAIEQRHGRVRNERWGPRTLDLDLLVYSSTVSDSAELALPHPRIAERNFVLLPLGDIVPHLQVPGLASVAVLADNVSKTEPRIEKINRQCQ